MDSLDAAVALCDVWEERKHSRDRNGKFSETVTQELQTRGDDAEPAVPGALSPSPEPTPETIAEGDVVEAAGILLMTEDQQILLMRRQGRDHAGEWAFPGGGLEEDETAEDAARREFIEETGSAYEGNLMDWTRRIKDGVDFTTLVGRVREPFIPTLNPEHDLYVWATRDVARTLPLHPGARVAIDRFDMDELGIARAMMTGDLVSPQPYANMLLVSLRITGTGYAYRAGLAEHVWREPSLYLNDEFLQRCNGLSVIWEHPKKRLLNSREFSKRIIGAVMLPFIRDDEVWGIARIYDEESIRELSSRQWSTSPGVRLQMSFPTKLSDGSRLLIEGKAAVLDHVAICEQGVWDKQEEPYGVDVVLDSQDVALNNLLEQAAVSEILLATHRRGVGQ
jgi:8-oxo-dGTP pyrophosphatase MutT (NUDIX family)